MALEHTNPLAITPVRKKSEEHAITFLPPRDESGRFKPRSQWSATDLRDYKIAEEHNLFPGRFRRGVKRKKTQKELAEVKALTKRVTELQDKITLEKPVEKDEADIIDFCAFCDDVEKVCQRPSTVSWTQRSKNPVELLSIINPKLELGEKIEDIIDFVKKNPLIALASVSAIIFVSYIIYKSIKTRRVFGVSQGVDVFNNQISFPGRPSYQITHDDMVWLARSLWGEVNPSSSAWSTPDTRTAGAAVLWSYANHYLTVGNKRATFPTLGRFVQAYSQPINPAWIDPSGSKCLRRPQACTPSRIQHRRNMRAKSWASFPAALQELVTSFAQGNVANPIGTRTDFRMAGTGYEREVADAINIEGNVFGTNPRARLRSIAIA
jgi:hypothetical protein